MASQLARTRSSYVLLVLVVVATLVGGIAAVSIADSHSDTIVLEIGDGDDQFVYGTTDQDIRPTRNECSVDPDVNGADLVTVTGMTYNKQGRLVSDAPLGLVEDGLGVNEKGNGNGQDCGRVDLLDSDVPLSEHLVFEVGPAITDQVFGWIDFDLEAKFDAEVEFTFYLGPVEIDRQTTMLALGSDSGPDSKFRDKYRVYAYPFAADGDPVTTPPTTIVPFNRVVVSMVAGAVSVEGGATWDFAEGDSSENHRTVFHLVDARTAIGVDAKVDGFSTDELGNIPAGSDLSWTFEVSNEGDLPLSNVALETVPGLSLSGPAVDSGVSNVLDVGETWIFTASSTAAADAQSLVATASGESDVEQTSDSDTVTYFGVTTSVLTLDITNNGVGDMNYIDSGDPVEWTITVGNTVGNSAVDNVSVTDALDVEICDLGTIEPGQEASCTVDDTAAAGENSLSLSVSATGACDGSACDPASVGPVSESYFGVVIDVEVEVTPNGVINNEGELPIVTTPIVEWTVKVTNNGNVPLTTVIGAENGSDRSCTITSLPVDDPEDPMANMATCTFDGATVVEGVVQSAGFTVNGDSPTGPIDEIPVDPVFFYGGFDCGDTTFAGGPFETDSPLTGVWLGPRSDDGACAFPIDVSSESTIEPLTAEQRVSVVAEEGFEFVGTSVVTIEWDAEIPDKGLLVRTAQEIEVEGENGEPIVVERDIPVCGGPVAVEIEKASATDFYYQLKNQNQVYDQAVPEGFDTCLIQTATITRTIDPDDEGDGVNGPLPLGSYSITIEVFYVFNDPIFVRR